MKLNKVILPILVLIISALVIWMIFNNKPIAKKRNNAVTPKLRIKVMDPIAESYKVWVPSYGIVKPKTQSLLIAQVSGQIVDVSDRFRDGAFFEKGDQLLVIDDSDYKAQLAIAKAELNQAEFTLADERARSKLAKKDWYKLGNTKKPPTLVSRELQLNTSLLNLEASKAKLLQAELDFGRTRIIAPFAGRVLSLDVNVGQVVNNGSTLGTVYAVDAVEIRLPLKQSDLVHLQLPESYRDMSAIGDDTNIITVKLSANITNETHHWTGNLVRVEGTIDAQTRQLYVVIEVTDPYKYREDGTPPLKIGQFVNALIEGVDLNNVLVIPRSAVTSSYFINMIENSILSRIQIKPLWQDDKQIIISNQFSKGQKISVTPLGDVITGTAVEIIGEKDSIRKPAKEFSRKRRKNS